jgi:hypothetical protein
VLSRCRVSMELATTRGDILCVEFSGDVSESVPFPVAGFGLTSRRPVEFSRPALGCPNAGTEGFSFLVAHVARQGSWSLRQSRREF